MRRPDHGRAARRGRNPAARPGRSTAWRRYPPASRYQPGRNLTDLRVQTTASAPPPAGRASRPPGRATAGRPGHVRYLALAVAAVGARRRAAARPGRRPRAGHCLTTVAAALASPGPRRTDCELADRGPAMSDRRRLDRPAGHSHPVVPVRANAGHCRDGPAGRFPVRDPTTGLDRAPAIRDRAGRNRLAVPHPSRVPDRPTDARPAPGHGRQDRIHPVAACQPTAVVRALASQGQASPDPASRDRCRLAGQARDVAAARPSGQATARTRARGRPDHQAAPLAAHATAPGLALGDAAATRPVVPGEADPASSDPPVPASPAAGLVVPVRAGPASPAAADPEADSANPDRRAPASQRPAAVARPIDHRPHARSGWAARARRHAARCAAWPEELSDMGSAIARLRRHRPPAAPLRAGLPAVPSPSRRYCCRQPRRAPSCAGPCVLPPRLPEPPERVVGGRRLPACRQFSHRQHLPQRSPATGHTPPLPFTPRPVPQAANSRHRQTNRRRLAG